MAVCSVAGGMTAVALALAVVLAIRVYFHPEEAILTGPLYLMVCEIFLPSVSFLDFTAEPKEMYYWATGLLIITCAAFLRLGSKFIFKMPRSLLWYTLVALASSVWGAWNAAETSYVVRQLFGALLLSAYFVLAMRGVSEEKFLHTFRFYGVLGAIGFLLHYLLIFGEYGFHKELTSLPTQCTILAIAFAARSGWKWRVATGMMLLPPVLDIMRRDWATFALGVVLITAFTAANAWRRRACWALAAIMVIASLAPPIVDLMLQTATESSILDRLMPEGTRNSDTVLEREMQIVSAAAVLWSSPVLGTGMGSSFESWRAWGAGSTLDIPYVDNGWAHLAVKMGFAGILTFGWFIVNMAGWMPGRSPGLSASLLAMLLLGLFVEPVYFNFSTSPFLGAMAGLVYVGRKVEPTKDKVRMLALQGAH